MRKRAAFTLIEVMIAATTGISVMIIAVMLLNQSMRLTSQSRTRIEYSQTLDRLSRQFRRDVRFAETAELQSDTVESPAAGELMLTTDGDTTVRYRFRTDDVFRPRIDRRVFIDGQLTAREMFRLMSYSQAVFKGLQSPRRIQLEVHSDETAMITAKAEAVSPRSSRLDRRVTAIVGRLRDLQRLEADQ